MNEEWESNTFAGLEGLDDEGSERVAGLGRIDEEADEPDQVSSALPVFDEMELDESPRLA
ncbi:MAG TPA: hypothetical protein RMH99_29360 [Sandaracinaceae bacterium LLY-WYZ-13_1]|nr:hypothetical protein [Sandaracinaceae bacterium LLY-WYZ-13_1]